MVSKVKDDIQYKAIKDAVITVLKEEIKAMKQSDNTIDETWLFEAVYRGTKDAIYDLKSLPKQRH